MKIGAIAVCCVIAVLQSFAQGPKAGPSLFSAVSPDGEWQVEAFEDAPDADVNAEHYIRRKFTVKAGEHLKVKLAPGGGFASSFTCAK